MRSRHSDPVITLVGFHPRLFLGSVERTAVTAARRYFRQALRMYVIKGQDLQLLPTGTPLPEAAVHLQKCAPTRRFCSAIP